MPLQLAAIEMLLAQNPWLPQFDENYLGLWIKEPSVGARLSCKTSPHLRAGFQLEYLRREYTDALEGNIPMYIVSLSFDDGFEKSNLQIADIYEKLGLSACFNVLAREEVDGERVADPYHYFPKGDFKLWNELQERGHEIMPHGLIHHNLAKMPLANAQRSITRCLEIFAGELKNFQAQEAVYNFAYNASTPEIEAWLPSVVKAFRTGGDAINSLPRRDQVRLTTSGYGPENCEWHLEEHIARLLAQSSGWLIYNLHGLDDEGWGPIRAEYLESLLERLSSTEGIIILPVGRALSI